MIVLRNDSETFEPDTTEGVFWLRDSNGTETFLSSFFIEDVPAIPRKGDMVFLGEHGGYDVLGVRHEYLDNAGKAQLKLRRVSIIVSKLQVIESGL